MYKFGFSIAFLFLGLALIAQEKIYNSPEDSDPEAKAILDEIKTRFQGYNSVEAAFEMQIRLADEQPIVQQGKIIQAGEKYYMDSDQYAAICNGEAVWMVLKGNKEVQINEMPESSDDLGMLSPESIFTFYESGNYAYIMANQLMLDNQPAQQIEFKVLDREADYSKLRLSVHKKTLQPLQIEVFSKDGSAYVLKIKDVQSNKNYSADTFTFNAADYPGFHIEDLR